MTLNSFLQILQDAPESIEFTDTMSVIEALYDFTETAFNNGDLVNAAGENSGSCKLFAFAQLQDLSEEQTLACFGDYYRDDVLQHPEEKNHQNIRNFMQSGWSGISFSAPALQKK
ncbi:HopJ type III effector protein [sulfur-oxidizing endosymbiont of Gigantopelta aegis]|uniref:HopJ type III effector protein n=1 Tax=sulfur-oxidizing endosymbiont of Gigantopelta aegis TaxID=2794934 RepID=UPI0018DB6804|nr:HopJ type III effector protein [sulfur-oxidizing endosymbiont of Gigantopelta aegis]